MKTKTGKKAHSVWIVALVAVVLVVSVTLASMFRITFDTPFSRTLRVADFDSGLSISFGNGVDMSSYLSNNVVTASADSSDENYIGNLRVSVTYKGYGVGLIRVHVLEEWSTVSDGVRTVQPSTLDIPYTIGTSNSLAYSGSGNQSKWYDNRKNDHCFYYARPVFSSSASAQTIDFIEGVSLNSGSSELDLESVDSNTSIRLIIDADVVQVNRYPQYWGLKSLPWTGGVSFTPDTDLTPASP